MAGNFGSGQNRGGGGFQQNRNDREDKSFTPSSVKIGSFYTADKKSIEPNLFDSTAKKVAESFIGKDKAGRTIGITSTQLRRIFDEVKRFEQILSTDSAQWEKQLPYIKMIKSKVSYTVARAAKQKEAERGVYKNLEIFISSSIDLIQSEKDYMAFLSLFEAAYGFYYGLAPKSLQ